MPQDFSYVYCIKLTYIKAEDENVVGYGAV
jgi:hypothetical protein